ncbi:chemotaxis protein CheW [Haladaptatus sp. NG-SE-30]
MSVQKQESPDDGEQGEETQVVEFRLGGDICAIDIDQVDSIVEVKKVTRIPRTPDSIEGVMDLRGTTTTIVNPKTALGLDDSESGSRVIVFETDDKRSIGWLIDEVNQVIGVNETDMDESVESESVRGVIRQDDEFVIWVKPSAINV